MGLTTYSSSGEVLINSDDLLSRPAGTVMIGKVNGSVSVGTGTPFYCLLNNASALASQPVISVSGSTISWTWQTPGANFNQETVMLYGAVGGFKPGARENRELRTFAANGQLQFSSDVGPFAHVASGLLTLNPQAGRPSPVVQGSLTVSGYSPFVAIVSAGSGGDGVMVNQERVNGGNGSWTYTFRAASTNPITIAWHHFDVTSVSAGASAPQKPICWDQYGTLTFHGGMRPPKIVGFIDLGAVGTSWTGASQESATSFTYPAGRSYAVVQANMGFVAEQFDVDPDSPQIPVEAGQKRQEKRILSSGSLVSDNVVTVGLAAIESYQQTEDANFPESTLGSGSLIWIVLDVSGLGTAPPASDFTPAPINWPDISFTTTGNYVMGIGGARTFSGLNQPIMLRIFVTEIAETFDDGNLRAMRSGTELGVWNYAVSGPGYFDIQVSNGDAIQFTVDALTNQGVRTGNATVTIVNRSDGDAVLDRFVFSGTVDSDNNHNVIDVTPTPISWGDLTIATNASSGVSNDRAYQITGINQPVTIRFAIGSRSGAISAMTQTIARSATSATGPFETIFDLNALTNASVDIAFNPGDWVYFNATGSTVSGRKDYLYGVFASNLTDGGANLGSFSVSAVVDADNNHNVTDFIPDPIDFANASSTTTGNINAVSTNYQTISGISEAITLRFSVSYSGNLSSGSFNVYSSTRGQFLGTVGLGSGSVDISVNPGESINLYCDGSTDTGQRSGTWNVTVTNQFAGGGTIDTTTLSTVVDSDNNYNVPDYSLDGGIQFYTNSQYGQYMNASVPHGGGYATGINQQIMCYAYVGPIFRGGSTPSAFTVYVGPNAMGWGPDDTNPQISYFYVNPGDFVGASSFLSQYFYGGDAYAYADVAVYNLTTGEFVSSFSIGLSTVG